MTEWYSSALYIVPYVRYKNVAKKSQQVSPWLNSLIFSHCRKNVAKKKSADGALIDFIQWEKSTHKHFSSPRAQWLDEFYVRRWLDAFHQGDTCWLFFSDVFIADIRYCCLTLDQFRETFVRGELHCLDDFPMTRERIVYQVRNNTFSCHCTYFCLWGHNYNIIFVDLKWYKINYINQTVMV